MRHSSSLQRKAGLGSRVAVSCSDWRCRRWPRSVTLERCELTAEGFVRNVGLVIVSMLLSACASRFTPSCAEKFRADSPAIQGRVLSFHPDVHPTHVLTCVAVPTHSGFSTDPDQEACLVEVEQGTVPVDAAPTSRLHAPPDAVRKLAPDLPEQVYAVVANEGGGTVYRTLNSDQVVLYAPYVRCIVREEVE